jgi:hypothetical protein
MPRPFMDSLPPLAERVAGRKPQPKELGAPSYDELQAWLVAEPALRLPLMPRWRPLLRDAEFRRALDQNLARHREWRRILYPPEPPASGPRPGAIPS